MMDERTEKALRGSIAHHEANLLAETPEDVRLGVNDCALCVLFYHKFCARCPVSEKTGRLDCKGTPYYELSDAHECWSIRPSIKQRYLFRAAEQAEIDFLKGLLP